MNIPAAPRQADNLDLAPEPVTHHLGAAALVRHIGEGREVDHSGEPGRLEPVQQTAEVPAGGVVGLDAADDGRRCHHVEDLGRHLQGALVRVPEPPGGQTHQAGPPRAVDHYQIGAALLGGPSDYPGAASGHQDRLAGGNPPTQGLQDGFSSQIGSSPRSPVPASLSPPADPVPFTPVPVASP